VAGQVVRPLHLVERQYVVGTDQVLDKPDHPSSKGTFFVSTPLNTTLRPRIEAKSSVVDL
jgi:hypothetical protein